MTERLRGLVDFAAEHGERLIAERVERIERELEERSLGMPGAEEHLRSRLDAVRLAVAERNGFAAAWLIEQAEQIVAAINAELTAPKVRAASGSARGREKTRSRIQATQAEKRMSRNQKLDELIRDDLAQKGTAKKMSALAQAARLVKPYATWAEEIGEKPLTERSLRKLLAERNSLAKLARVGQ